MRPGRGPRGDSTVRGDRYHRSVKQLIARIEARLHERLKQRAAVEGRSMNAVVTDLLEKGLSADDERARFRARLKEMGMLSEPPRPRGSVPTHEELRKQIGPDGARAVIEAFEAERKRR